MPADTLIGEKFGKNLWMDMRDWWEEARVLVRRRHLGKSRVKGEITFEDTTLKSDNKKK